MRSKHERTRPAGTAASSCRRTRRIGEARSTTSSTAAFCSISTRRTSSTRRAKARRCGSRTIARIPTARPRAGTDHWASPDSRHREVWLPSQAPRASSWSTATTASVYLRRRTSRRATSCPSTTLRDSGSPRPRRAASAALTRRVTRLLWIFGRVFLSRSALAAASRRGSLPRVFAANVGRGPARARARARSRVSRVRGKHSVQSLSRPNEL